MVGGMVIHVQWSRRSGTLKHNRRLDLGGSLNPQDKEALYRTTWTRTQALLEGEQDWIAGMATVACEYHTQFPYFHWTGFYRSVEPECLVIGPYQGSHMHTYCLIKGRAVLLPGPVKHSVPDVHAFPGHIACSATTQSEIVVPIVTPAGVLLGVLDVDSDIPNALIL